MEETAHDIAIARGEDLPKSSENYSLHTLRELKDDTNIKELESIFEYVDMDDDCDVSEDELTERGVTIVNTLDSDESIASFSTDVSWYKTYVVSYKDKKYRVHLSGEAMADISYDRWVDTSFYRISDVSVVEDK